MAPHSPDYLDLVLDGASTVGAFDDADADRLAASEPRSFWFRGRNRLLVEVLRREFPAARSVLEVGCGTGFVLGALGAARPELELVGTDLSGRGLAHARRRAPRAVLCRANVLRLPFVEEFDVVGAFDVLEHIEDDSSALEAMRAAARPGGGMLLTVPQHRWLWSESDRYAGHHRRYRRRELKATLSRAGVMVRWASSFTSALLPAMALSRARQALSQRPFDPGGELTLDPRMDRVLGAVMAVEAGAIAAGARLPAGGSLLIVAERR